MSRKVYLCKFSQYTINVHISRLVWYFKHFEYLKEVDIFFPLGTKGWNRKHSFERNMDPDALNEQEEAQLAYEKKYEERIYKDLIEFLNTSKMVNNN